MVLAASGAGVAPRGVDEEDELQEEAAKDEDAQLPFLPLVHLARQIQHSGN
jgi:hypothetical protein